MINVLRVHFTRDKNGLWALTPCPQLPLAPGMTEVSQTDLPNVYELMEELLSYGAETLLFLETEENRVMVQELLCLLRRQYPEQHWERQPLQEDPAEVDDSALWNGTRAFLTGLYPGGTEGAAAKHIFTEEITDEVLQGLGTCTALNHTLFHLSPAAPTEGTAERTGYLAANHARITGGEGVFRFSINGGEAEKSVAICPYHTYRPTSLPEEYVTFDTREDFEALQEDLAAYAASGVPSPVRLWKPDFVGACRLMGRGNCCVETLSRFRLAGKTIRPCPGSSYSPGTLDDPFFRTAVRARREKHRTAEHRHCTDCPAADRCSRCMALPDYLGEEEFCALMRDERNFPDLFRSLLAVKLLVLSHAVNDPCRLRTAVPDCGILAAPRGGQLCLRPGSFLFAEGDERFLLFSMATGRVFQVSRNFFFLSELAARGYRVDELMTQLPAEAVQDQSAWEQGFATAVCKLREYAMME